MKPPAPIIRHCAVGLHEADSNPTGTTPQAVLFATLVTDGFPLDDQTITEAIQAHRQLDQSDTLDPTERTAARRLWGGPTAPDWLTQQAAELTQPVAAALAWETPLAARLETIDTETIAALDGAFATAVLTAARLIGARLIAATRRLPEPVRATLDMTAVETARPHGTWWAVDPTLRIAAALDIDESIDQATTDLGLAVRRILENADRATTETIAAATEIPADDITEDDTTENVESAVGVAVASFAAWVAAQFSDRAGDTLDPAAAVERLRTVPPQITAAVAAAAGGAVVTGPSTVARDQLGQIVDRDGIPTGGSTATPRWRRTITRLAGSGLIPRAARPIVQFTWLYGSPATRGTPFPPHRRLDGVEWELDKPAAALFINPDTATGIAIEYDGYFPGDHIGCQCRISTSITIG